MVKFLKFRTFSGYRRVKKELSYLFKSSFNGVDGLVSNVSYGDVYFNNLVVADQPSRVSNALVFTSNAEWLTNSTIAGIANNANASFGIDVKFNLNTLGINHTLVSFGNLSNGNPCVLLGVSNSNKIRVQRRHNTANTKTYDVTSPILSNGVDYTLSAYFNNGNVSIWLDGLFLVNNADYSTSVANSLPLTVCSIGARVLNTVSLPLVGSIKELRIYE